MFTLASASCLVRSPSVPGRSSRSTTRTSRSSAMPIPARLSASRQRSVDSSSTSTWTTPLPSPVKAARPWILTPARPTAHPSRASSPGRLSRMTVRSIGIALGSSHQVPPVGNPPGECITLRGSSPLARNVHRPTNHAARDTGSGVCDPWFWWDRTVDCTIPTKLEIKVAATAACGGWDGRPPLPDALAGRCTLRQEPDLGKQSIEPPKLRVDRQDLHRPEPCLGGETPHHGGSQNRPGRRALWVPHHTRQAGHDAPPVVVAVMIGARCGELVVHSLIGDHDRPT